MNHPHLPRWSSLLVAVLLLLGLVGVASGEPVQVFILAGQSNMDGRGRVEQLSADEAEFARPQEGVLYYHRMFPGEKGERFSGGWIPLAPPSVAEWPFGPELTFGQRLQEAMPHARIALIKVSRGGTSLSRDWPSDDSPRHPKSFDLYPKLIATVREALQALRDQGMEPELAGFIWVQGWSDAGSASAARDYGHHLAELFASVRRDLSEPELPVVFNRLHAAVKREYKDAVRAAQRAGDLADKRAVMVDIDDLELSPDGAHFPTHVYLAMGRRLADAYLALVAPPDAGTQPDGPR